MLNTVNTAGRKKKSTDCVGLNNGDSRPELLKFKKIKEQNKVIVFFSRATPKKVENNARKPKLRHRIIDAAAKRLCASSDSLAVYSLLAVTRLSTQTIKLCSTIGGILNRTPK